MRHSLNLGKHFFLFIVVIIKVLIGFLNPFLVPLVKIIPSWPKFPKPLLAVKDKLRVVSSLKFLNDHKSSLEFPRVL